MKLINISEYIRSKLNVFTPFILIIIIIVAFFIITVVKHQKIQINQQVIKLEVTGQDWTNNHSQFEGYRPPVWLVKGLNIGDQEFSPDGRVVAEILDVDYFERKGGNAQVFLYVQIETVDNFSSGRVIYKGKNVEVGQKIDFHFNNTFVVGQVTDIFDVNYKTETKDLLVSGVYKAVSKSIADSIVPGMQILNPYTMEEYAKIEMSKVTQSAESTIYKNFYTSAINFRTDHNAKDVEIVVRLQAENIFGNYYFSGHQVVKLGENVTLFFPKVNVILEITDVTEIEVVTE